MYLPLLKLNFCLALALLIFSILPTTSFALSDCRSKVAKKGKETDPEEKIKAESIYCSSFRGAFSMYSDECLVAVQEMKSAQVDWQEAGQRRCAVEEKVRGCFGKRAAQLCDFDEVKKLTEEAISAAEEEKKMAVAAEKASKEAKARIANLLDILKELSESLEVAKKTNPKEMDDIVKKEIGAKNIDEAAGGKKNLGGQKSSDIEKFISKIHRPGGISGSPGSDNPITDGDISGSGAMVGQPLEIAKFAGDFQNAMKQRQGELESFKQEMQRQKSLAEKRADKLGDEKKYPTGERGDITTSDPKGKETPSDSSGTSQGAAKPEDKQADAGGGSPGGGSPPGGGGGREDSAPSTDPNQFASIDSRADPINQWSDNRLRTERSSLFNNLASSGNTSPNATNKSGPDNLSPNEGPLSNPLLSNGNSKLDNGKRSGKNFRGGGANGSTEVSSSGGDLGGSSSSRSPATIKAENKGKLPETSGGTFDEMGSLGTPEFSLPGSELDEFSQTLAQDLSGGASLGDYPDLKDDLDYQSSENGITSTNGDYALVELQNSFKKVFHKYQASGSLMGPPKRGPSLPR